MSSLAIMKPNRRPGLWVYYFENDGDVDGILEVVAEPPVGAEEPFLWDHIWNENQICEQAQTAAKGSSKGYSSERGRYIGLPLSSTTALLSLLRCRPL